MFLLRQILQTKDMESDRMVSAVNYLKELKDYLSNEEFETLKSQLQQLKQVRSINVQCNATYTLGESVNQGINVNNKTLTGNNTVRSEILEKFAVEINREIATEFDISVYYTDYEERLIYPHFCSHTTIDKTDNPEIVCSKVMGIQRKINISVFEKRYYRKLKTLKNYLQHNQYLLPDNFDYTGIKFSIWEDNIMIVFMTDLDNKKNISYLQQCLQEHFYTKMKYRNLIKASCVTVNLEHYFSPLLQRLVELKTALPKSRNEISDTIVGVIIKSTLKTMSRASVLLDNNRLTAFLRSIYQSFLLNCDEMTKLVDNMNAKLDPNICREHFIETLCCKTEFKSDWDITVLFNVRISARNALQKIVNKIKNYIYLHTTAIELKLDGMQMVEEFSNTVDEEIQNVVASILIQDIYQHRHLEEFLSKNIPIDLFVDFSTSLNDTTVEESLLKRGVKLTPTLPIFIRPSNISTLSLTTNTDGLTVKWDFEGDARVQYYHIELVRESTDRCSNVGTITMTSKRKLVKLPILFEGKYKLTVQAIFGDIDGTQVHGTPSLPIMLSITTQSNNSREEKPTCSICEDAKINTMFMPCGHTSCNNCAENICQFGNRLCHYCRQRIINVHNVFIN